VTGSELNTPVRLLVGLGNPGTEYQDTRHNAGAWFVESFARKSGASFTRESKFYGRVARISFEGEDLRLLLPDTYMNESGRSVAAVCQFFKIPTDSILVAHDEIDLPTGTIRLKQGGGLAGHNGLKDISACLGNDQSFNRLRIGVGRPDKGRVVGHVLSKASQEDRDLINEGLEAALDVMPTVIRGDWQKAMMQLHNRQDIDDGDKT